ncbi:hypothetical protein OH77DRAFT_1072538 [Trametes cingulata]|nr:hypothetical protein OH77DRAFT_1072538 [Trametes cingulata]
MTLPSASPRLGRDVLHELMYHLPRQSDVFSLMRTSKTLWDSGVKPLLDRGVTVEKLAQLSSFCDFMLNGDGRSRSVHLRKLHVAIRLDGDGARYDEESDTENSDSNAGSDDGTAFHASGSKDTLRKLAQVLQNAPNLEELRLDSCEELFERHMDLAKSVTALTTVRRLLVSSIGPLAAKMLDNIKSTLIELDVHCGSEEIEEPDTLFPLVKSHQASLEKLSAWYVELDTLPRPFPRVTALALRSFFDCILDVASLQRAFPSLRYLELSEPGDLEADESREANRPHAEKGSWTLAHLCGSLNALCGLGMAPHATKLEVDHVWSETATLAKLRTVVSEARPSHLVLHTGHLVFRPLNINDIPGLLPTGDVPVTHLTLNMCPNFLAGPADKLLMFVLRLAYDLEDDEGPSTSRASGRRPELLAAYAETLQQDIVRELVKVTSSLQHVVLTVSGVRTTYWVARRAETTIDVDELDGASGRALVQREGLAYNDRSIGIQVYP